MINVRYRLLYFIFIIVVIILGLSSRHYSNILPWFIGTYAGDTLWALMVFFIIGFIFNKCSTNKAALISLIFSYSIEFSQLYHAPWVDSIRKMKLGGLILGYGFLWSDLVCYAVGIFIGVLTEYLIIKVGVMTNNTHIKY